MTNTTAWLLLDDRAGNRSQVMGVAERLGLSYEIKEIRYNAMIHLPYWLMGGLLGPEKFSQATILKWLGIDSEKSSPLTPPWPRLVIAAGRRASRAAALIRQLSYRDSGGKQPSKLVQIMRPDPDIDFFQYLVIPAHDDASYIPHEDYYEKPIVIRPKLAPHGVTAEKLKEAAVLWEPRLAKLRKPRIAVLAGGNSKHARYAAGDYIRLCELTEAARHPLEASLMITTSRRTSDAGRLLLAQIAASDDLYYDWHAWQGKENPYMGFLALADAIIVTADSISMLSEAVATAKPVYVYEASKALPPKFTRFLKLLYDGNHARPLAGGIDLSWKPSPAPDAAEEVAERIKPLLV